MLNDPSSYVAEFNSRQTEYLSSVKKLCLLIFYFPRSAGKHFSKVSC